MVLVNSLISLANVAENIRFWRCGGNSFDDAADIVDKAHIEHAIRFIQHQHFQIGEFHLALLVQVEQAPRRGHQNVDALAQRGDLRVDLHATKYHGGFERQVRAVRGDALRHLGGEFARGRENQYPDAVRMGRSGGMQ